MVLWKSENVREWKGCSCFSTQNPVFYSSGSFRVSQVYENYGFCYIRDIHCKKVLGYQTPRFKTTWTILFNNDSSSFYSGYMHLSEWTIQYSCTNCIYSFHKICSFGYRERLRKTATERGVFTFCIYNLTCIVSIVYRIYIQTN